MVAAAILVAGGAVSRVGQAVCTVKPPPGYCGVSLWSGGTVPYEYDPTIAGPEGSSGTPQFNLRQAMNAWETAVGSRIRFVRSPNDPQRVVIVQVIQTLQQGDTLLSVANSVLKNKVIPMLSTSDKSEVPLNNTPLIQMRILS